MVKAPFDGPTLAVRRRLRRFRWVVRGGTLLAVGMLCAVLAVEAVQGRADDDLLRDGLRQSVAVTRVEEIGRGPDVLHFRLDGRDRSVETTGSAHVGEQIEVVTDGNRVLLVGGDRVDFDLVVGTLIGVTIVAAVAALLLQGEPGRKSRREGRAATNGQSVFLLAARLHKPIRLEAPSRGQQLPCALVVATDSSAPLRWVGRWPVEAPPSGWADPPAWSPIECGRLFLVGEAVVGSWAWLVVEDPSGVFAAHPPSQPLGSTKE